MDHTEHLFTGVGTAEQDYPYPENLIRAVLNKEAEADSDFDVAGRDTPADYIGSVEYAIHSLPQRMAYVIHSRFLARKTLAETAQELGITSERARQIEVKAVNYLRSPKRKRLLIEGVRHEMRDREAAVRQEALRAGYESGYAAAIRDIQLARSHDQFQSDAHARLRAASVDISKAVSVINGITPVTQAGFSQRTVNLLQRAGLTSLQEVQRFHNLYMLSGCGEKCVNEIVRVMEDLGYDMI